MTKSKDGMYWVSGWQHGAWKYDPSSIRNLTVNDSIPASGKNKMIVDQIRPCGLPLLAAEYSKLKMKS